MKKIDLLKKAFRLEIPVEEIFKEPEGTEEICRLSNEDLLAALQNLKEKDWTPKELYEKWSRFTDEQLTLGRFKFAPETGELGWMMVNLITSCAEELKDRDDLRGYIDYALMIEDLQLAQQGGKKKEPRTWRYTDMSKLDNIEELDDEDFQVMLSTKEVREYRDIIEELISRNYPEAIYIKAYSCYVGDRLYKNNWKMSRDLLLQLMDHPDVEDEDKCWYANMLGYIYYYGRTNRGKAQYEEAARYFMIGALAGIHESMYKLADLYIAGKGVLKNEEIGVRLIVQVYRESRDEFLSGDHLCKFADAALRMGNLYRDGIGVYPSQETALYYYLIADLAIRLRMEEFDYIGDTKVAATIREELAKIRGGAPEKKHPRQMITDSPFILREAMKEGRLAEFKVERLKRGIKLTAIRVPAFLEQCAPAMLMVLPEWDYCRVVDKVVQYAYDIKRWEMARPDAKSFRANRLDTMQTKDGQTFYVFFRDDEWVATIQAERFVTNLE